MLLLTILMDSYNNLPWHKHMDVDDDDDDDDDGSGGDGVMR
jgi:hypothetical protein